MIYDFTQRALSLPFLSCKPKPEKRVCGLGSGFGSRISDLGLLWDFGVRISGLLVGVILVTGLVQPGQAQQASLSYKPGGTLTITGSVGMVYSVQSSTNLSQSSAWQSLTSFQLPSSPYDWVDPSPASPRMRFYRVAAITPPSMVFIPSGTFTMGSPTNEVGRSDDEGPQTSVTIRHSFWMGAHSVTQQEYSSLINTNPSYFIGDLSRPVEQVSWNDASNYCATLTSRDLASHAIPTGWYYRLPTEAEWEYSARAGTTNRFFYGDDPDYTNLTNYAWYEDNSSGQTHPVAQKLPNPWGLYDIAGNIPEWCLDWYAPSYSGGSAVDPQGPLTGSLRVIRGGGYFDFATICRSAARNEDDPTSPFGVYGFRVVLVSQSP